MKMFCLMLSNNVVYLGTAILILCTVPCSVYRDTPMYHSGLFRDTTKENLPHKRCGRQNAMHREMVSHDAANSNKTASDLMMHFITNEKTFSSFLVRYNDKNNFGDKN